MNSYVRDMLMARSNRDGRNPYGSRGGYVTSNRRDRGMNDYAMDYNNYDSARYDMGRSDYASMQPRYDMRGRDYGYSQQRYDGNDYGYDMRMRDYGGDYGRDYGEQYGKMSQKDIEKWKHSFKNADGSQGEHFNKEQVMQATRSIGINDMSEFGSEDIFCLAMNMMYSDYCMVARKYNVDRPDYYAELAKAFLKDKDFGGKPEEKLYLYYKCIAEEDN